MSFSVSHICHFKVHRATTPVVIGLRTLCLKVAVSCGLQAGARFLASTVQFHRVQVFFPVLNPSRWLGFVTPPWGGRFGKRLYWLNLFLYQPLHLQFMRGLSIAVFFRSGLLLGWRFKTALLKLCAPQPLGLTRRSTSLPLVAGRCAIKPRSAG